QMHMRIDAARHDNAPARVDNPPGQLRGERTWGCYGRNDLARNRHVALMDALGCDYVAAANDCIEHPASQCRFAPTSCQPVSQLIGLGRSVVLSTVFDPAISLRGAEDAEEAPFNTSFGRRRPRRREAGR